MADEPSSPPTPTTPVHVRRSYTFTPEEERAFEDELRAAFPSYPRNHFHELTIQGITISLLTLYRIVQDYGGADSVSEQRLWKTLGKALNVPPSCTACSSILKSNYLSMLYNYEKKMFNEPPKSSMSPAVLAAKKLRREGESGSPSPSPSPAPYGEGRIMGAAGAPLVTPLMLPQKRTWTPTPTSTGPGASGSAGSANAYTTGRTSMYAPAAYARTATNPAAYAAASAQPTGASAAEQMLLRSIEPHLKRGGRVVMSLQSGLPNEVDWAIHILLSRTEMAGADFVMNDRVDLIDALLDLVAPFMALPLDQPLSSADALENYAQARAKLSPLELVAGTDAQAFPAVPGLLLPDAAAFAQGRLPLRLAGWVKNVADIFANLSFAATNVPYIAASRPIVQFQLQCLRLEDTSAHVSIRASALTVLVNIATSLRLEHYPTLLRQVSALVLTDDRAAITTALRILVRLSGTLDNDYAMASLDLAVLARLIPLVLLDDEPFVHAVLEFLSRYTAIGPETAARVGMAGQPGVVSTLIAIMASGYRGWQLPRAPPSPPAEKATGSTSGAASPAASASPAQAAKTAAGIAEATADGLVRPLTPSSDGSLETRARACITWIQASYHAAEGARLPAAAVYDAYCADHKDQPLAYLNFTKALKSAFPTVRTSLDVRADGSNVQIIENLAEGPTPPTMATPPPPSSQNEPAKSSPPASAAASDSAPAAAPSDPAPAATTSDPAPAAAASDPAPAAAASDPAPAAAASDPAPDAAMAVDAPASSSSTALDAIVHVAPSKGEDDDRRMDTTPLDSAGRTEPTGPSDLADGPRSASTSNTDASGAAAAAATDAMMATDSVVASTTDGVAASPPPLPPSSTAPAPDAAPPAPATEASSQPNGVGHATPTPGTPEAGRKRAATDELTPPSRPASAAAAEPPAGPPADVWPCRWAGCTADAPTSGPALLEHVAHAHCSDAAAATSGGSGWTCAWGTCTRTLPSQRALVAHIQPHLPVRGQPPAPSPAHPSARLMSTGTAAVAAGSTPVTPLANRHARPPPASTPALQSPSPGRRHKHSDQSGPAFLAALVLQNLASVPALRPLFAAHQSLLLEWSGSGSRLAPYTATILADLFPSGPIPL